MPLNLNRSDQRLLLWAAAILLPLIAALAILSDQQESELPSSYSADSQGAKAAYLLLQDQGYKVERWEQSPTQLPIDAANTLLVMAFPFTPPSREEKAALQLYLSRGGRILATGFTISLYLPEAETETEAIASPDWKDYQPQLLTSLTRGGSIKMSPGSYWKSTSTGYLVHYADGDRPVVVSYKVGRGEVIWWGSATPLTNSGISAAGNLPLLLNSVGNKEVHILWDEYFHGYRQTVAAYLAEPPLKYGLLQCGIVLLAMLLTYSRRNLPIHPLDERSRLSPLEFVETLGGLYRRAKATRVALEVPYIRFRTLATRRLGLRPDTPAEDLTRSLRDRLGYKDDALSDLLRRIEAALAQGEPSEQSVLELTQELNIHLKKLKLVQQETIAHAERVPGAKSRTS